MDTFENLIRELINDVHTLEWNKYLIMELIKYIQEKIEVAMEHGDTWRLWGPHKKDLCATWHPPLAISNPWEA